MEIQQRQVAYKFPINALLSNQYVEQEGWNPNYLQIDNKQVSRVNLIAIVIDKQVSGSLATLVLDDSTGIIQARLFNEDVKKVAGINIGDTVLIIARPRVFNDQKFLAIEIARKVNPVWTMVRKLELQKKFDITAPSDQHNQHNDTKQAQDLKQRNQYNEKFLGLIKENDDGSGADIDKIISLSGLKEGEAQEIIVELIKLGEVYEPRPNKIKILG
ncbi:hypothetical protein J4443_01475 [Candidatus Woesearchaeota archaeon]|nr:hypothetical protein [Candidatus Woesearchaeota archaeon]